ncbi:tyrosine-type recombinase/integrase [Leucobacter sp. HY1910]
MVNRVSVVRVRGPLEGVADQFRAVLVRTGYTPLNATDHLRLMAHVSRWMSSESIVASDLTDEVLDQFLVARRSAGYASLLTRRGLIPLVEFLRAERVMPLAVTPEPTALDVLLDQFAVFLEQERGLVATTIAQRIRTARSFLASCEAPELIDAACVSSYVSAQCRSMRVSSANLMLTDVRSLLRFLHVTGRLGTDLSPVVLGAAGWRHSGLPKGLSDADVSALLAACQSTRSSARRDRAVMLLLIRLGLRRVEVSRLTLDDIDWRAGELVITGKANRMERLPLPVDAGQAIAEYLEKGRPRDVATRSVFLTVVAPHRPLSAAGVGGVVAVAARRAGLPPVGSHRLRHTVATTLLNSGADLLEIGQVLRHRNLSTTVIYAKVDLRQLQPLAQSWPVVGHDVLGQLRLLAPAWPGGQP